MSGRHFTHIVKLRVTVAEPLGGGQRGQQQGPHDTGSTEKGHRGSKVKVTQR